MTDESLDHTEETSPDATRMPFTEHLRELRRRLVICTIFIAVGFGICYYFSKPLLKIMMLPLLDAMPDGGEELYHKGLVYTGLPEAFFTYLKIGLWGGVILSSPVIFYQIWRFVAPGLYKNERRYLIPFVVFSSLLFFIGGFFGYFVVFPFGFRFFLTVAGDNIMPMLSVKEYFSLTIKLLFGFGLVFELPLVMVFLGKIGLVNARMLSKGRKYAIFLVFVVGAILTPPDVVSQILMALPLIVLYEISIVLVRLTGKKSKVETATVEGES